MSVQVVAMPWREELCLRAMLEVEVRTPHQLPTLARCPQWFVAAVQAGADFEPGWAALEPTPRETKEMGGVPVAKL